MNRGRSLPLTVGIGVYDTSDMRLSLVLLIAACGSGPLPPSAPAATTQTSLAVPQAAPCTEPRADRPTDTDATRARRAEVLQELDRLDRQLDAIDGELAAAARNTGLSLVEARTNALARKAMLDAFDLDKTLAFLPGTPPMLGQAIRALFVAKGEKLELGLDLGAQHPRMLRLDRHIAYLLDAANAQLTAERAFMQAWVDTLAKLPEKAKPDAIYKARLQALRATLPTATPSDSPADVRLAREQLVELTWTQHELSLDFGPKHPDMVVATARLEEAKAALTSALAAADNELGARIAAPMKQPDSAAIARRAELADQARELRRAYERLVVR
jgi:hypothetical protein